jgi:hypothetical protein
MGTEVKGMERIPPTGAGKKGWKDSTGTGKKRYVKNLTRTGK